MTSKPRGADCWRNAEDRQENEKTACFSGSRAELADIWLYIFGKSERAADRLVEEIAQQYDQLCDFPGLSIRREELGPGYRSLPVGIYVIYYRVIEDEVEISHILHGSKDVTGIFPEAKN